jgi:hypothetical protein
MRKPENYCDLWECHSGRIDKGARNYRYGHESSKGKSEKGTEVQSEKIQQMPALRTCSRLPTEVRYVQDMFQAAGPRGEGPGCEESQLVKVFLIFDFRFLIEI